MHEVDKIVLNISLENVPTQIEERIKGPRFRFGTFERVPCHSCDKYGH